MTTDELTELDRLRAENAALKAEKPITFKVGQKGGVSVYGLGRFPTTLYVEQWERLLDAVPALREFLAVNEHQLARKDR